MSAEEMSTKESIVDYIGSMCLLAAALAVFPLNGSKQKDASSKFDAAQESLLLLFDKWEAEIKEEVKKEMGYQI